MILIRITIKIMRYFKWVNNKIGIKKFDKL